MNIITYHAADSEFLQHDTLLSQPARVFRTQKVQTRRPVRHTAAAADMRSLFAEEYNTNFQRNKSKQAPRLPRFSLSDTALLRLMLIFAAFYALMAYPVFRTPAGSYSIKPMHFATEPAFTRAMHSYVFPEQDIFEQEAAGTIIPDYVSRVTFKEYTVKKGETISGIASRAGLRNFGTLLSVNNIDNARRISAGQVLQIPSADGLLHTVKKNETLASIAAAHNVSVTALLDTNDLTQEVLTVGQKLFIPGAALSAFELRKALGELFIYPIHGRLTSPFGYRKDPFTGAKSFHSGIDLAAPTGTPVKATLDGRVVETGFNRIFGNYVIISHDRGYQSLYGHLHSVSAKRGQYVGQGAVIGTVGNTGYSTGPHLHLSIYKNGNMINPFSVLK
ncbi:MAG: M23 family metallopeptidase [Treponema sp.]